jgi:hypothetical protein
MCALNAENAGKGTGSDGSLLEFWNLSTGTRLCGWRSKLPADSRFVCSDRVVAGCLTENPRELFLWDVRGCRPVDAGALLILCSCGASAVTCHLSLSMHTVCAEPPCRVVKLPPGLGEPHCLILDRDSVLVGP